MALTFMQKEWRKAARMCAADVVYSIHHATDGRDEFRCKTAEEWAAGAVKWAKQSAHSAFEAHPELRG